MKCDKCEHNEKNYWQMPCSQCLWRSEKIELMDHFKSTEPKVLTAEEFLHADTRNCILSFKDVFEFAHKNGRLERDLELRPAMLIALELAATNDSASPEHEQRLSEALKNIPPLDKPCN